jgi:hypothetical protein
VKELPARVNRTPVYNEVSQSTLHAEKQCNPEVYGKVILKLGIYAIKVKRGNNERLKRVRI